MPKVRIKSNPYKKQITYWKKGSNDANWCQITYGGEYKSSNLIKDCFRENYFSNVMNEAFKVLVDEFGDKKNKLEIQFEGVSEEYDSACNEVRSKYSNDIVFLHGEYYLKTVDDVLKIEKEVIDGFNKSIPENCKKIFENSITDILKNQKNEGVNKYQVAMDIKNSLEKLISDAEENTEDEIDRRRMKQEQIDRSVFEVRQHKESNNKSLQKKRIGFNNFVDGLKKKDVIDVKNFLKCFSEKKKSIQKDGKSTDEIRKEIEKWINAEFSKRIQAFRNEINQQLYKYIQSVGEEVEIVVKNDEKDIICEIPGVDDFCDEMRKKFENFNFEESNSLRNFFGIVLMPMGVGGLAWRLLSGWFALPAHLLSMLTMALLLADSDNEKEEKILSEFNKKFMSEFSKWYDKNVREKLEKYFEGNQKKVGKFFSTELQKLENEKSELRKQIEQLNNYLAILDCYSGEVNSLFQWESYK